MMEDEMDDEMDEHEHEDDEAAKTTIQLLNSIN